MELNSLDTSGLEMKAAVFKQLIRCEEPIDRQKMIKKTSDPGVPLESVQCILPWATDDSTV